MTVSRIEEIDSNLEKAAEIAEQLRQEPYDLFWNDCITKSMRFKRECKAMGIPANVVVCIGLARAKWFGHWLTVPVIHGWGKPGAKGWRHLGRSAHRGYGVLSRRISSR